MPEPSAPDLVEQASILRLRDEVGAAATVGMVDRFLAMLPERIGRLHRAVAVGETPELRDATLSLGSSATMLGAHRLAELSERCRTATGDAAEQVLAELEVVAGKTATALTAVLRGAGEPEPLLSAGR